MARAREGGVTSTEPPTDPPVAPFSAVSPRQRAPGPQRSFCRRATPSTPYAGRPPCSRPEDPVPAPGAVKKPPAHPRYFLQGLRDRNEALPEGEVKVARTPATKGSRVPAPVGIVSHVSRRSGRAYRTPVKTPLARTVDTPSLSPTDHRVTGSECCGRRARRALDEGSPSATRQPSLLSGSEEKMGAPSLARSGIS
jgi:hypothetical protein